MKPQQTVAKAGKPRKTRRPKVPRNRLCQLPDEISLQIITNLTAVDIQVLKRTCRHLMRLCADPKLDIKYAPPSDSAVLEDYRRLSASETAQLRQTLRRGHLCAGCRTLREHPEQDFAAWIKAQRMLWCSACRVFHPALMYSYRERAKSPSVRICIGRQGRVRLCRHKTFSWAELQSSGEVVCTHEEHLDEEPSTTSSMGSHSYRPPGNALQPFAMYRHSKWDGEVEIFSRSFVSAPGQGEADAPAALTAALRAGQLYRCPHLAGAKSRLRKLVPTEYRPVEPLPFWDWPKLGYTIDANAGTTDGVVPPRMGTETIFCNAGRCRLVASSRLLTRQGPAPALELSLISQAVLRVSTPASPDWLDALDPKSYLSTKDELTRGIMWCDDPDCPTSFRSIGRHNIFYGSIPLCGNSRYFYQDCYFPQWTQEKVDRPHLSTKKGPNPDGMLD